MRVSVDGDPSKSIKGMDDMISIWNTDWYIQIGW